MVDVHQPFVVIMGDSLTQMAPLRASVCGLPLVNAGVTGSRASVFVPLAEEMTARKLAPALIIIALGVNDAIRDYHAEFKRSYELLLDSLPKSAVALATPAPIDGTMSDGATIDPATLQQVAATIRATAITRGLIDLGKIGEFQTRDGIHPTEQSYPIWIKAMIDGIESALKCGSVTNAAH